MFFFLSVTFFKQLWSCQPFSENSLSLRESENLLRYDSLDAIQIRVISMLRTELKFVCKRDCYKWKIFAVPSIVGHWSENTLLYMWRTPLKSGIFFCQQSWIPGFQVVLYRHGRVSFPHTLIDGHKIHTCILQVRPISKAYINSSPSKPAISRQSVLFALCSNWLNSDMVFHIYSAVAL